MFFLKKGGERLFVLIFCKVTCWRLNRLGDWVWWMLSTLLYCVCLFFQEFIFILSSFRTVNSASAVLGYFTVFQCCSSYMPPCLFNALHLLFTFSKQPIAAVRNVTPWSLFLIAKLRFPLGSETLKSFEMSCPVSITAEVPHQGDSQLRSMSNAADNQYGNGALWPIKGMWPAATGGELPHPLTTSKPCSLQENALLKENLVRWGEEETVTLPMTVIKYHRHKIKFNKIDGKMLQQRVD